MVGGQKAYSIEIAQRRAWLAFPWLLCFVWMHQTDFQGYGSDLLHLCCRGPYFIGLKLAGCLQSEWRLRIPEWLLWNIESESQRMKQIFYWEPQWLIISVMILICLWYFEESMFGVSHILSELRVLVAFNESACSELGPAGCDDWRGKREDDGNQGGEADLLDGFKLCTGSIFVFQED